MRGVIKARTAQEAIEEALNRGITIDPVRQPDKWRDEWYVNFGDNTSVESVANWFLEGGGKDKPDYGVLLFFSNGKFGIEGGRL
jgi:hypothetical protein